MLLIDPLLFFLKRDEKDYFLTMNQFEFLIDVNIVINKLSNETMIK